MRSPDLLVELRGEQGKERLKRRGGERRGGEGRGRGRREETPKLNVWLSLRPWEQ